MILPKPIAAYDPYRNDGSTIEIISTSAFAERLLTGPGRPALADWVHHQAILLDPEFVYEGLRDDRLFDETAAKSDTWLCFTGRVTYYHDVNESGRVVRVDLAHAGLEECYCVFVNGEREVYFAEFRDCAPDGRPRNWERDFGRVLVERHT